MQLNYFITISEQGSLTKASEQLFVSQPSLSSAVKELEKELGVKLLHRTSRGVTLTNDGVEFLPYAREIYQHYQIVMEKYTGKGGFKRKFAVSTQHYSFAVKSFSDMIQQFDTAQYEFAILETKTMNVIQDVATLHSEIGVLYLSNFNRRPIQKLLAAGDLEFHHLIDCRASVYLWKGHPLAEEPYLTPAQLEPYPCLSFEQGDNSSFYLDEEILSTRDYPRVIRTNDRASMLNLMVGQNGYTLCSGLICEELNGSDYRTIELRCVSEEERTMEIGYITKKNVTLSPMGERYIGAMKNYLHC